jgi:hypothetical protein
MHIKTIFQRKYKIKFIFTSINLPFVVDLSFNSLVSLSVLFVSVFSIILLSEGVEVGVFSDLIKLRLAANGRSELLGVNGVKVSCSSYLLVGVKDA